MIDYIEEKGIGLYLYQDQDIILNMTMKTWLNHVLCYTCNTLSTYLSEAKKKTQQHYLLPIYLNDYLMLFPIYGYKHPQALYVNMAALIKYIEIDHDCIIHFMSGRTITVKKPCKWIEKQIKTLHLLQQSHKKTFSYWLFQSDL
jgi:hypothetical protein